VLTFEKGILTTRYGTISHYEKLILGDAWLGHIAKADPFFPQVGANIKLIGGQSFSQLKDKMLSFFKTIERFIELEGPLALSYCFNKNVIHKMKIRGLEGKAEPCIALNLQDILAHIKSKGNYTVPTKEEINYFVQILKMGENGISLFKTDTQQQTMSEETLNREVLSDNSLNSEQMGEQALLQPSELPLAQEELVQDRGSVQTTTLSLSNHSTTMQNELDMALSQPITDSVTLENQSQKRAKKRAKQKISQTPREKGEGPKPIRVALLLSKARLVEVFGPVIKTLWKKHSLYNEQV